MSHTCCTMRCVALCPASSSSSSSTTTPSLLALAANSIYMDINMCVNVY